MSKLKPLVVNDDTEAHLQTEEEIMWCFENGALHMKERVVFRALFDRETPSIDVVVQGMTPTSDGLMACVRLKPDGLGSARSRKVMGDLLLMRVEQAFAKWMRLP